MAADQEQETEVAAGPTAGDSSGESASAEEMRLPPADFSVLVNMFATQAMVALGVIPHPSSGKSEPQLPLARHFIEMLGVLEQKCQGNLEHQERELLQSALHHLRLAFVEKTKSKSG